MTFDENIKALGFKDMHEEQIKSFLCVIDLLLTAAGATGDEELFNSALDAADDIVVLFGGNGVKVEYTASY
jgi:hypothetical protein